MMYHCQVKFLQQWIIKNSERLHAVNTHYYYYYYYYYSYVLPRKAYTKRWYHQLKQSTETE